MALIKSSPGQQWPGFSFALHPLRVQGFYFALLQYSRTQAFTARFASSMQLYSQRHKTACRTLQALFLRFHTLNRQRYQTDTSGYNTACTTLERITAPHQTLYRPAQHPIIIRYIRAATYRRPCQPGGVSVSTCTGSAQRLAIWHPPPDGAVKRQGRGGRRGTIGGCRCVSFRAFAR